VLSLLTSVEERDLNLAAEFSRATEAGLRFISLPIPDRQVPTSPSQVAPILDELDADLAAAKNVVIHCRQGVGRSGMLAACLLVLRGCNPAIAVAAVTQARGTDVPETPEQRHWIDLFASNLTRAC
jgi:protein-tyrosine phosphatase